MWRKTIIPGWHLKNAEEDCDDSLVIQIKSREKQIDLFDTQTKTCKREEIQWLQLSITMPVISKVWKKR